MHPIHPTYDASLYLYNQRVSRSKGGRSLEACRDKQEIQPITRHVDQLSVRIVLVRCVQGELRPLIDSTVGSSNPRKLPL